MTVRRDLDGIYFRVERDGHWCNRCWTDLTDEERELLGEGRSAEWWKGLAEHLTKQLRFVGDQFGISASDEGEDE